MVFSIIFEKRASILCSAPKIYKIHKFQLKMEETEGLIKRNITIAKKKAIKTNERQKTKL